MFIFHLRIEELFVNKVYIVVFKLKYEIVKNFSIPKKSNKDGVVLSFRRIAYFVRLTMSICTKFIS